MTNLGLPVPPGFIITTEACRAYLRSGSTPRELLDEVRSRLDALEHEMGRTLGDLQSPAAVGAVRGEVLDAGMMETVLNIGLNDESVHGLAEQSGNERFAWDSTGG